MMANSFYSEMNLLLNSVSNNLETTLANWSNEVENNENFKNKIDHILNLIYAIFN